MNPFPLSPGASSGPVQVTQEKSLDLHSAFANRYRVYTCDETIQ
jgi:hypothetical protein